MRFFCDGFRGVGVLCLAGTMAMAFAGCSEDPGLQERVNRLQAEMQEKDRQLQDAQSSLEKTKSELKSARASSTNKPPAAVETPAPSPSPAFLPREQVEEGYTSASKSMQKRIASELKSYTVENCTEFPVVMPTDEHPYHSKILVAFRSDSGRSYRLEFPVSADAAGKWNFPTSSDVAGALADSRSQDPSNLKAGNPQSVVPPSVTPPTSTSKVAQLNDAPTPGNRPTGQNSPPVVPGQTSTETRVIDWGDSRNTNNGNNRPDRSPTPARTTAPPAASTTPAPAMPADKDVRIHW